MTREKRLNIRLSEKERQAIEFIAFHENLNLSETSRLIIREAARNRGLAPLGGIVIHQETVDEKPDSL